ncbi:MAG: M81 family metallopeptidase [Phyllobacterium sp.]
MRCWNMIAALQPCTERLEIEILKMRIVVARLNHETNTFSPVPTPLESFNPKWGEDARAFGKGSNTALGAFHDYAERIGAELVTPLAATANPSGPVDDAAFEHMTNAIVDAVRAGCDAILLDLHGAMVTRSHDDGEGELLERVRKAAPGIPLGVALDLHGNMTQRMIDNCDCIVGFKTYPHIDMHETGRHVTEIVDRMLNGKLQPRQAWCHPPMLAHTLKMNTNEDCAMTDIVNLAREAEKRDDVFAVTLFGGFAIADLAETGLSIVVVAQDEAVAQSVADEIALEAWRRREDFLYQEAPLAQSILDAQKAADASGQGPVLLLDHGDNCMSGGTCDNMDVLQKALAAGLENIVAGPFCDPHIVEQMTQAGTGARVTIALGNKTPAEGFVAPHAPLQLAGTVHALSAGDYVISGPIYTGQLCHMGRAAVLKTGQATILITEQPHEPWDLGVFNCAEIDPLDARFLILKSRMYCRPVFQPRSKAVIECASSGVTSSNYDLFSFKKLNRPIYPLDSGIGWKP